MAYVYKKSVDGKPYYYLRASARKGTRIITKDITYLGATIEEVRARLETLPKATIRQAHRNIEKFLASNTFLEKAKELKIKSSPHLEYTLLEEIEACRLHWQQAVSSRDTLTKKDLITHFAIDFSFNTTSIEGNTITLQQAQRLLTEHLTPPGKTLREVHDVQNTAALFWKIFETPPELGHEAIIDLHRALMQDIDPRSGYRTGDVHVIRASFDSTPAPYVKTDMGLLLTWYEEHREKINPFALAGIFHHKFEKIHPFFDGNGRVGRVLLNTILLHAGYPPLIVRKSHRTAYLDGLHDADNSELTQSSPKDYQTLLDFLATEFIQGYWDHFL